MQNKVVCFLTANTCVLNLFSILAGIWHTFDGAAYFPGAFSDGYFKRLKALFGRGSFGDRLHHDAIASAEVFLPSADDIHKASLTPAVNGQTTMEGYLDKIGQVMSSLRHQMFRDSSHQCVDEPLVKKVCLLILPQV